MFANRKKRLPPWFEAVLSWTVLLACVMVIAYGLRRLSNDTDAFRTSLEAGATSPQVVDGK